MWTLLIGLNLAAAQAPAPRAPAPIVAPSEAKAIQRVIDDQIAAFRRDDAAGAWKHVAPGLRFKFGSADRFLRMVRDGYAPVYRPRDYAYRDIVEVAGGFGQWMDVTGPNGERVRALYLMERQPDGTWRTMGCLLYAAEPAAPAV